MLKTAPCPEKDIKVLKKIIANKQLAFAVA